MNVVLERNAPTPSMMQTTTPLFTVTIRAGRAESFLARLFDREPTLHTHTGFEFSCWLTDQPRQAPSNGTREVISDVHGALTAIADKRSEPRKSTGARTCSVLSALACRAPAAKFVLLVESPASMLIATGLNDAEKINHALHAWYDAVGRMLSFYQSNPDRCALVSADEAWLRPSDLADLCQQRWGAQLGTLRKEPRPPKSDPLQWAVAERIALADDRVSILHDEVLASCSWLGPLTKSAASVPCDGDEITVQGIVERLNEMKAAIADRLNVVSSEVFNREREVWSERAVMLEALQESACASLRSSQIQLREIRKERDEDQRQLAFAELHLQQVQEELETLALENRPTLAHDHCARGLLPLENRLHAVKVTVVSRSDEAPFRQVDFLLSKVTGLGCDIEDLLLRLVEHHGQPGLAIFEVPGLTRQMSSWQHSGDEGERAFMLVVPSDAKAKRLVQRMPAREWAIFNELTRLIEDAVRTNRVTNGVSDRWLVVARRLRQQLTDLPACFRYDRLALTMTVHRSEPTLTLEYGDTDFEGFRLPKLKMHWRLGYGGRVSAEQSRVELAHLSATDADPPIVAWPVNDDGGLAPTMSFDLGPLSAADWSDSSWAILTAFEKRLIASILATFPTAARDLQNAKPPSEISQSEILEAATSLRRKAIRHAFRPGPIGFVRTVLAIRFGAGR